MIPIPDNDPVVERAVLASMILRPAACYQVLRYPVTSKHFVSPRHQTVYAAVRELYEQGADTLDLVVLEHRLSEAGAVPGQITWGWLQELFDHIPSSHQVASHIAALDALYVRRCKAELAGRAADLYRSGDLEEGDALLAKAGEGDDRRQVIPSHDQQVDELEEELDRDRKGREPGVTMGFRGLDSRTGGFQKGASYVLAGLPSMGKTALGLQMVTAVALAGEEVHYFSREMHRTKLLRRMAAAISGIPIKAAHHVRQLDPEQREKLEGALKMLRGMPLTIDDRTATLPAMMQLARGKRGKVALYVIDHVALVEVPKAKSEYEAITAVSRAGKRFFGTECEAACLLLSQFNRAGAKEGPRASNMRGSGALEEDPDVIMFVDRKAYMSDSDSPDASVRIVKNRLTGACGGVKLIFDDQLGVFVEPRSKEARDA